MLVDDPLWYKDAIIYHLHIKSFFDANNDGLGDFAGLASKLDYIESLGVTAIWLLPFYPSPLRDDGYDIADYVNVNAAYGDIRDFRAFVRAAHLRGLRVITELVINHTSDQHAWFQQARHAPKGSPKRDFYVWSDDDKKFADTRIIFSDTESSNWAWDPVAKAYYWHRFFSHQPDLNLNNPKVVKAVQRVLRFWLDAGVDGLRLDAIPYLCVRDGTNNENLPETHAVIRQIREQVDAHYRNRMLLAEANQWPEDVIHYFGDGDECHMAFHFPVMPRIYLAVAQGDREPITDILRQTPSIPDNCQWAIFLRNHDELTLEMVSEQERAAMVSHYARDPRMMLNVGIRRRLAPLMDNDRRKLELLNSMLFALPGTPIIYYGDELGMGDNVYLGDRNGVRTPMQWSADRNAGFSRADPQRLYSPPVADPVYGYQAVNVESQLRAPSSLLNWMRQMIGVRKNHRAFGRGDMELLYPKNRHVLALLRRHGDEEILCVFNLAFTAQPVELDLRRYAGHTPIELLGGTVFPRIGELPYLLTMPAYGFYWFRLFDDDQVVAETHAHQELPFVVLQRDSDARTALYDSVHALLPQYLGQQRWFLAKHSVVKRIDLSIDNAFQRDDGAWLWSVVKVELEGEDSQTYSMPLALLWDEQATIALRRDPLRVLAKLRQGARVGVLCDAYLDQSFCVRIAQAFEQQLCLDIAGGQLRFQTTLAFPHTLATLNSDDVRAITGEQSHTSIIFADKHIYKSFRLLQSRRSAEVEIGRYLTENAHFANSPPVQGFVEFELDGKTPQTFGVLMGFVESQGDGWAFTTNYLEQHLEHALLQPDEVNYPVEDDKDSIATAYVYLANRMGLRTAQLHIALAAEKIDPTFATEPITDADLEHWNSLVLEDAHRTLDALATMPELQSNEWVQSLLLRRQELYQAITAQKPTHASGLRCRFHGDFHLGQVLVQSHDVQIIDFEGEMVRPQKGQDIKHSPLRDVAGMLRSFNYAALATATQLNEGVQQTKKLDAMLAVWERQTGAAFLQAYLDAIQDSGICPSNAADTQALIRLFVLEKALYEINYELNSRPHWLAFPIRGVLRVLDDIAALEPVSELAGDDSD